MVDGDKVFWLGRNVTMKDLHGLPSEPTELKAWLLHFYRGHGTESSGDPMSSDAWLFAVTVGLITDMPVSPKVRGAAFRMLAELKTVEPVTLQDLLQEDQFIRPVVINGPALTQSRVPGGASLTDTPDRAPRSSLAKRITPADRRGLSALFQTHLNLLALAGQGDENADKTGA